MKRLRHFCFVLVILLVSTPLIAEKKKKTSKRVKPSTRVEGDFIIEKRSDGTTVRYKKKNVYDFEGTDIEGLFKRPSGSYISNLKGVKGKSIIRIRKNFDDEVVDSVRFLK